MPRILGKVPVQRTLARKEVTSPVPAVWDPTDQAGLILNLDSTDLTSLWENVGKTIQASDGGIVKIWEDEDFASQTDYSASAAPVEFGITGANPIYRASIGGHPAVDMTAGVASMVCGTSVSTNFLIHAVSDYTFYFCFRTPAVISGDMRHFDAEIGRLLIGIQSGTTPDSPAYFDGSWHESAADPVTASTDYIMTVVLEQGINKGEIFTQEAGVNTSRVVGTYAAKIAFGQLGGSNLKRTQLGNTNGGGSEQSACYHFQNLIYDTVHSVADQNTVRAGLVTKFSGLSL